MSKPSDFRLWLKVVGCLLLLAVIIYGAIVGRSVLTREATVSTEDHQILVILEGHSKTHTQELNEIKGLVKFVAEVKKGEPTSTALDEWYTVALEALCTQVGAQCPPAPGY